MAAVNESSKMTWDGKPFWGLVQQKGPWQSTRGDRMRASMKDVPTIGGGNGVGGTRHAGHGNHAAFMTPYQINGTRAPPRPSHYAMRSVVMGPVDMKRQTKMGRVKNGLTLAGRTPLQNGQKMGVSTQTEGVQSEGYTRGVGPDSPPGAPPIPNQLPDLVSPVSDASMHTATASSPDAPLPPGSYGLATGSFITQHHVAEQATLAEQLGYSPVELAPGVWPGHRGIVEERDQDNIMQLAVKVEEPPLETYRPPRPDLSISQSLYERNAAYEREESERRRVVMDKQMAGPSTAFDERYPQNITTEDGRGKKLARSSPPSPIDTKGKGIEKKSASPKRRNSNTKLPTPKPKKGYRDKVPQGLAINTTNIGPRFIGKKRAEKNSKPSKNQNPDQLPSPKTRAAKARARRGSN